MLTTCPFWRWKDIAAKHYMDFLEHFGATIGAFEATVWQWPRLTLCFLTFCGSCNCTLFFRTTVFIADSQKQMFVWTILCNKGISWLCNRYIVYLVPVSHFFHIVFYCCRKSNNCTWQVAITDVLLKLMETVFSLADVTHSIWVGVSLALSQWHIRPHDKTKSQKKEKRETKLNCSSTQFPWPQTKILYNVSFSKSCNVKILTQKWSYETCPGWGVFISA